MSHSALLISSIQFHSVPFSLRCGCPYHWPPWKTGKAPWKLKILLQSSDLNPKFLRGWRSFQGSLNGYVLGWSIFGLPWACHGLTTLIYFENLQLVVWAIELPKSTWTSFVAGLQKPAPNFCPNGPKVYWKLSVSSCEIPQKMISHHPTLESWWWINALPSRSTPSNFGLEALQLLNCTLKFMVSDCATSKVSPTGGFSFNFGTSFWWRTILLHQKLRCQLPSLPSILRRPFRPKTPRDTPGIFAS